MMISPSTMPTVKVMVCWTASVVGSVVQDYLGVVLGVVSSLTFSVVKYDNMFQRSTSKRQRIG
jgi:hypothetical protein